MNHEVQENLERIFNIALHNLLGVGTPRKVFSKRGHDSRSTIECHTQKYAKFDTSKTFWAGGGVGEEVSFSN